MGTFNKNVTEAATKLSKGVTEFAAKNEIEKKVEDAKKEAADFATRNEFDRKVQDAKEKAEKFSRDNELEKKLEEVKGSAETFVKQHELDVKMNEAKISVEEQAKKHNLDVKYVEVKQHVDETVLGVKSGVEVGVAAATEEEEKSDNNEGSSNNEEGETRTATATMKEEEEEEEQEQEETETAEKGDHPGDVTFDALKNQVNAIAKKIEVETKNLTEKEEVQKVLTLLMAKLAIAKSKFIAMTQKSKDKGDEDDIVEDELGVEVELGKESQAEVVVENNNNDENDSVPTTSFSSATPKSTEKDDEEPRQSKLPSVFVEEERMVRAKKAVKNALENAEIVVKKAADRFGIRVFDHDNTKETTIEEIKIETSNDDDEAVVEESV